MARKMATLQICIFLVVAVCSYFTTSFATKRYQPKWEDLDKRPLPSWYDDVKFGIFIHWGVFSVPSFGSEWFWFNWKDGQKSNYNEFMQKNYPPNFTYQDFARDFTAEFFNASEWAEILKTSGAKYVVLTSKHHEGFTLWPSKYSFSWNAVEIGPRRDIVGELSKAVRNQGLTFGVYYSLYEWFNPLWIQDRDQKFNSTNYVDKKAIPALYELVNAYKPDVIWSDGDWEAPDNYWKSKEFLAWLYNDSPVKDTVVANDRWGHEIPCHHGDFYTCTDRYNPGHLLPHKWENCMTIDKQSWGFRRNAKLTDYLTLKELVNELVVTVACGGNLLMNVGPTKEGIISPIYQERLRGMGEWLAYNGDAIYNTKPWTKQNDTYTRDVWYTKSKKTNNIFITFFNWPKQDQLKLASISIPDDNTVALLEKDSKRVLKVLHDATKSLTTIQLPPDGNKGAPAWVLEVSKRSKKNSSSTSITYVVSKFY